MKKTLLYTALFIGFIAEAQIIMPVGGTNSFANTDGQQLTLVGDVLTLENSTTVDLTPYLDNTDGQTVTDFSLFGNTLSITLSGGNTVNVDLSGISGGGGTDDQTAPEVVFTPNGSISSTNVQTAIQEVRNESVPMTGSQNISGVKFFTDGIALGNGIASGSGILFSKNNVINQSATSGGTFGKLYLDNSNRWNFLQQGNYSTSFDFNATAHRIVTWQDKAGTVAYLSDTSTLNNTTTSTATDEAATANVAKVLQDQINGLSVGAGNPNITIVTTTAEIAAAGVSANIEFRTIVHMDGDFTPPANQHWYFTTGSIDPDTFLLDPNGATFHRNGTNLMIDFSNATVANPNITGNVLLSENIVYASNFGADDTDSNAIDNTRIIQNALHIVNQNSAHLIFNKVTDGVYHKDTYEAAYGSPFFPTITNTDLWLIGNSYDNVTIEVAGNVEIKSNPSATSTSNIFHMYNTRGSYITGGTIRGDRYTHYYDMQIEINVGASSAGNVRLRIIEHPDFQDNITEKEINELIALTSSNLTTNTNEVIDYVNNNAAFSDWSASNGETLGEIELRGPAGQYSSVFFTDESSGAGVTYDISRLYEWGHGITFGSNTIDCWVSNMHITEFHGDGVSRSSQGNGTPGIRYEHLSQGFIDDSGTIDAGNTDYYYLTSPRNLPSPEKHFSFAANSEASVDLTWYRYWMVYYDAAGNFLAKSPQLTPYEIYTYPLAYEKYRILVDNNGTKINNFNYFVNAQSVSFGGGVKNSKFTFNRRHNITNPPPGSKITGNTFQNVGGVEPESSLNIEDYQKRAIGYTIENNTFENTTAIDIILKGPSKVNILNNRFKAKSWVSKTSKSVAISGAYSRETRIEGNFFDNKSISIDLGTIFKGNRTYESEMIVRSGGSVVSNNIFVNTTIEDGAPSNFISQGAADPSLSYVQNNHFFINRGWGNSSFIDEKNTLVWTNNTFEFNHTATQHGNINDPSLRLISLQGTSQNYIRANRTVEGLPYQNGKYYRNRILGIQATPSSYHQVGWVRYANDIIGEEYSTSLIIGAGFPKSFEIKDTKINGWMHLRLNQYETDGIGAFETIIIDNVVIDVPDEIDANEGYLNNAQYGGTQLQNLVRITKDANVNIIFKEVTFRNNNSGTGLMGYFGNRGSLTFDNCTWDVSTSQAIDFTSSGNERTIGVYAGANLGNVTNINPTILNESVTFTYRGGDTGLVGYGGSGGTDTAAQIVTKLETLSGVARLDASAIQNLPAGGALDDDSVSTVKLQDNAVTSNKIATDAVTSDKILNASINGSIKIQPNSITEGQLSDNSVGKDQMADNSVGVNEIDDSVTGSPNTGEILSWNGTNIDWVSNNAGLDLTADTFLDNSTGNSPKLGVAWTFGGNDYNTYFEGVNGGSYWGINANGINRSLILSASSLTPSTTGVVSLGTPSTRYNKGWFSAGVTATAFDSGGTTSQLVSGTGLLITNNYLSSPSISQYSINRISALDEGNGTVNFTNGSSLTYTIDPNATIAHPIGTRILVSNENATTVTLTEGAGVTLNGSSLILNTGQAAWLIHVAIDEWLVLKITEEAAPATSVTGTAFNLSGYYQYNFSSASSATTFTMTDMQDGGYAEGLINTTSAPTVTGATLRPNTFAWVTGTDLILHVKDYSGTIKYWFTEF